MCPSYDAWQEFVNSPSPIQDSWIFVHLTKFPVGVRVCEYKTFHREELQKSLYQRNHKKI